MGTVFGRISFFVNAGVRFVEEHAKLRAMGELWDELGRERYGVEDPKHRRFRYGVQVNSLGLTEAQPENNVQRIVLEALAVTLGRDARARAIQLPAWNEALGLPRPWDQQWSLRIQQVLAYETDLLEYPDIFEGSKVMEGLVAELAEGARDEMARVAEHGGAVDAVAYMKAALVDSHRERLRRIEAGEQVLVGVNSYRDRAVPADGRRRGRHPRRRPGRRAGGARRARRVALAARPGRGHRALEELARVAATDENVMEATIAAARAGVTTGEWAQALRDVFGSYRAPTGVGEAAAPGRPRTSPSCATRSTASARRSAARRRSSSASPAWTATPTAPSRSPSARATSAWTSSTRASGSRRRRSPTRAVDEGVHVIGLSILSGSHRELIPDVIEALREAGGDDPRRRRRDHPGGRRRAAEGRRRRGGVHAEGLRPHEDHARHRSRSRSSPACRMTSG